MDKEIKINEKILKISSAGVNLPEELGLGKRYLISTEVDIVEVLDKDKQDGSKDRIFKAKQIGNLDILTEGKRIIKATGKKKMLQKLHGHIYYLWQFDLTHLKFEDVYNGIMQDINVNLEDIVEFLKNKRETFLNKIYNK